VEALKAMLVKGGSSENHTFTVMAGSIRNLTITYLRLLHLKALIKVEALKTMLNKASTFGDYLFF